MSAATTRSALDGRGPWHPEQAITRQEALMASARGRARIRAGDPADLAVLDADPFGVPDGIFASMPVAATLLAGRFTYDGGAWLPTAANQRERAVKAPQPGPTPLGAFARACTRLANGSRPYDCRNAAWEPASAVVELIHGKLFPGDEQGPGTGKLPNQPSVPMAGRLALAEVNELLDLPAQTAVALAAGTGFPHVEDVGVVNPFGSECGRLQRSGPSS